MAEQKTRPSTKPVSRLIADVESDRRRRDAEVVLQMMREVTGVEPVIWGETMVGFGSYDYTYDSGHSGTYFRMGFAPRKANLVLYVLEGDDAEAALLDELGPHKRGKSCLYVTNLDKVDHGVLRQLMEASWARSEARDPS